MNDDILKTAERRFLTDAEFSARVKTVIDLLAEDLRTNTGQAMNSDDRSLAAIAASVALVLAEASTKPEA